MQSTVETAPQVELRALLGDRIKPWRLLGATVQLALILLVIQSYRIEELNGFVQLTSLILGGFIIHAVLPMSWRRPFFLLMFVGALVTVMGVTLGGRLLAVGLAVFALCHLPGPFWVRVVALLGAGAGFVALYTGWIASATAPALLPVLGSIFMFRTIIYLYDLRHEKTPSSWTERLSYFFLFPNVTFIFFPLVDYATFRRTYYDKEAYSIYEKGLRWIMRGVIQLLAYRLVYYYVIPTPSEVTDLGSVALFMVTSYLLYLRISGQFHIVIGLLCLFGYNLPETHHQYFLASGFNDLWRRINIYWKDFMMKIFYYPIFFRLRRYGITASLLASTMLVFVISWLFHSYQWFGLRGTFPLTWPDATFWLLFGVLVSLNTYIEATRGRKRTLKKTTWDLRRATVHALKVTGMFVLMCLLWSLWSSPTLGEWGSLLVTAVQDPTGATYVLLFLVGAPLIGVAFQFAKAHGWTLPPESAWRVKHSFAYTSLTAFALLALAQAPVQQALPGRAAGFIASLQEDRFNQRDTELFERGYYEALLGTDKYTSQLWQMQMEQPADWTGIDESDAVQPTDDVRRIELIPSHSSTFKRATLQTNEHGMRDQPYALAKPDGTFRLALLGASYEMGAGVENGQVFEALTEEMLNERHPEADYDRYEVLNFAVGGYSVIQQLELARLRIFDMDPDVLLLTGHSGDVTRSLVIFTELIMDGTPLPPFLEELRRELGLSADMEWGEVRRALTRSTGEQIVRWGYGRLAEEARMRGITPVWLFMPRTDGLRFNETPEYLAELAEEAGFLVYSLEDAYGDTAPEAMQLAPWDAHLNAYGHRLAAEALYEVLRDADEVLGLKLNAAPPPSDTP